MENKSLFALAHETFHYQNGVLYWKKPGQKRVVGAMAGHIRPDGYFRVRFAGKSHQRSRIVWLMHHGYMTDLEIDHINRVRNDDRIENLREANHFENTQNRGLAKNSTTGHTGVYYNKRDKTWFARVFMDGEHLHVGCFKNKEDAIAARAEKAKKLRGEFYSGA